MPTTAKIPQHRHRHSKNHWGRLVFFGLLVVVALAVIVGLLVLMNNPSLENRH